MLSRQYARARPLPDCYDSEGRQRTLSYQSMHREARPVLAGEFMRDVDMVKAFPSIVCSIAARRHVLGSIPLIEEFATNGERLLGAISKHHSLETPAPDGCGLSHDDAKGFAKELCNSLMHEGNYQSWVKKHGIVHNARPGEEEPDAVDFGRQAIWFRDDTFEDETYKPLLDAEYTALRTQRQVKLQSAQSAVQRAKGTSGFESATGALRKAEYQLRRVKPSLWSKWLMMQENKQLKIMEQQLHVRSGLSKHIAMSLNFDGMQIVHNGDGFGLLIAAVERDVQSVQSGDQTTWPFFKVIEKPLHHKERRYTCEGGKEVTPIASSEVTKASIAELNKLMGDLTGSTASSIVDSDGENGEEQDDDSESVDVSGDGGDSSYESDEESPIPHGKKRKRAVFDDSG